MKRADLKSIIIAARDHQIGIAIALSRSSNPQVTRECVDANAKAEALIAVLEALDAPRPTAAISLRLMAAIT